MGTFFEIAERMWDVLRKDLFVCKSNVSTVQGHAWLDTLAKKELITIIRDLPGPKLEYDALHRLILLTVHNSYDIISVLLQEVFFGGGYVVIVGVGADLVENAQTLIIIQQKLRKGPLTCRSRETLDDFLADVNLAIGGIAVEAYVNDACGHQNEVWRMIKMQIVDGSFINESVPLAASSADTLSKVELCN